MLAYQKALNVGVLGPEALEGLQRAFSAGLSSTSAAMVLQKLQNYTVAADTTFKVFLEEMAVLVTALIGSTLPRTVPFRWP